MQASAAVTAIYGATVISGKSGRNFDSKLEKGQFSIICINVSLINIFITYSFLAEKITFFGIFHMLGYARYGKHI